VTDGEPTQIEPKVVICGIDGSLDSIFALGAARVLAEELGARLVAAHVIDPIQASIVYDELSKRGSLGGTPMPATQDNVEQQAGEAILEQAMADAGALQAERRLLSGKPADSLAALADEERAALIFVGSRGRGGLKTLLLGSVSNGLIAIARCPVVVVPPGAQEPPNRDT
jgi:nucleotide-binding universal stress UspA family protein